MKERVELEALAGVPEEHRGLIATWLAQTAASLKASWLLPEHCADTARQHLYGAAADLMSPDEAPGVNESNEIITRLLNDEKSQAMCIGDGPEPHPIGSPGCVLKDI